MLLGKSFTVIGGDNRYVEVIKYLAEHGAHVFVVGFENVTFDHPKIKQRTLENMDVSSIDGIILPLGGTDEAGKVSIDYGSTSEADPVINEKLLKQTKSDCVIYTGTAKTYLRQLAHLCGRELIVLFERDDVAIANSIPTAEAALQIAMEHTPHTIHGANVLIIGFGRIGMTIAHLFQKVGASVTVAARKQADIARIRQLHMEAVHIDDLTDAVVGKSICVNTVPVVVLTEKVIQNLRRDGLIIDLASKPGGTDFDVAERLGIQAIHALGLPGKVAPKTAGIILGETIAALAAKREY